MRRTTIASIVALLLLAALAVVMQFGSDRDKAIACLKEQALIDSWKSVGLIDETRPNGNDLIVTVAKAGWTRLPRQAQMELGQAAYCKVRQAGKGGAVRIESDGEIARVENGKWTSKVFPE